MKKKYISEVDRLNMVIMLYSAISCKFCDMINIENRGRNWDWNSNSIINDSEFLVYAKFFYGDDDGFKNTFVKEYKLGPVYSVDVYVKKLATDFYNTLLKNSGLGERK